MRKPGIISGVTRIGAVSSAVFFAFVLFASSLSFGQGPAQDSVKFPLWNFDEVNHTCRAKGRLQDKEYCESKTMDQIIAQGKSAIPILVSELTDTRATQEPIFDYWHRTTAGDIAHSILDDLFTDSDWETFTMPGLEALKSNCSENLDAETCWRGFLKNHGRKFVQDQWLAAWNANKDRVYWDDKARCFRVSPKVETKQPPRKK
jgi:hypothetical protein